MSKENLAENIKQQINNSGYGNTGFSAILYVDKTTCKLTEGNLSDFNFGETTLFNNLDEIEKSDHPFFVVKGRGLTKQHIYLVTTDGDAIGQIKQHKYGANYGKTDVENVFNAVKNDMQSCRENQLVVRVQPNQNQQKDCIMF